MSSPILWKIYHPWSENDMWYMHVSALAYLSIVVGDVLNRIKHNRWRIIGGLTARSPLSPDFYHEENLCELMPTHSVGILYQNIPNAFEAAGNYPRFLKNLAVFNETCTCVYIFSSF
jgi:hypothetical protein